MYAKLNICVSWAFESFWRLISFKKLLSLARRIWYELGWNLDEKQKLRRHLNQMWLWISLWWWNTTKKREQLFFPHLKTLTQLNIFSSCHLLFINTLHLTLHPRTFNLSFFSPSSIIKHRYSIKLNCPPILIIINQSKHK